ncbi:nucleotidyltransferase domain-containing protein [Actinokineospora sp. NBRC 105648]|uniref:nucleotidyltransferase domain-containing protein n=1 Tax=Actinokineospora sp. NBRC 105648 TaxID=3032206 RepID=UPI0024A4F8AE|nr:nucleotidyltransferase domain-containing protein [Actinokineospora sp. NBRC 105648]GLZ36816.1 hypothetical protein Acsp05_04410 [Actinokineospora sp. NBRC 105648]
MNPRARELVLEVVEQRYPRALAAFLAGSHAAGTATRTSDIDLVVIHAGPAHRDTIRHGSQLVEVFAHSRASLWEFVDRETELRRSPLLHMCATGVLVRDRDAVGAGIQAQAVRRFAAGPPPLSDHERDDARYAVTDLLDDLDGARDPGEAVFVSARLLVEVARLALARDRQWLGNGKWLWRRLHAHDPALAETLRTDPRTGAVEVLGRVGGSLRDGYRR